MRSSARYEWLEVSASLSDAQLRGLFACAHAAMRANLRSTEWARRFPRYGRGAVHGRGGAALE